MTSPVEIIAAHQTTGWYCECGERCKTREEFAAHVAAVLEEARPKPSVSDVETIALAWMRHQGYTEEKIEKAANATHQNSGCEAEGYDWLCYDENGKDNHPEWNDLSVAAEMANVALEALEEARREDHTVTEEWGVERGAPFTGVVPLFSKTEAERYLKAWSPPGATGAPTLMHREISYGPWRPSASEEGDRA